MRKIIVAFLLILTGYSSYAQRARLDQILDSIANANPYIRMYDYDIQYMDEAAKGAKSWMPPEVGAGFFMTPYNTRLWQTKTDGTGNVEIGMGQFMVSAQQMFPNPKKLNTEYTYMAAMSSVEREKRKSALNQLYADIKKNYYQWIIVKKKQKVLDENERLLQFMIQSAELRYKNGLEKINAYYKAKAALGNVQRMQLMFANDIDQKRIAINTFLNRDKATLFDIDTTYLIKDHSSYNIDSNEIATSLSDIKAVDREIQLNQLRISSERAKLLPEFGVRYDHMIGLAQQPSQFSLMGMMRIPLVPWSSRMNRANIESFEWRNQSLLQQRQMLLNEASGMAQGMLKEINTMKKQIALYEGKIIPALYNNYRTFQLAYEQNTEELFMLFDAWETLNMTQIEYLDQLQRLLVMQAELERILEIR